MKKTLASLMVLTMLTAAIISVGCGGGGGGGGGGGEISGLTEGLNDTNSKTGNVVSGSVVLPADTADAILKSIVANSAFSGLQVHIHDTDGKDIADPVDLGDDGTFVFQNIPENTNYQLVVVTPSGKSILRKHIDSVNSGSLSVTIDPDSTALAILVMESNYARSESNLKEIVSAERLSEISSKIGDWLSGSFSSSDSDVSSAILGSFDESEVKQVLDNVCTVSGYVKSAFDGTGVTGAEVSLSSISGGINKTVSTIDGKYTFNDVPAYLEYHIIFSQDNHTFLSSGNGGVKDGITLDKGTAGKTTIVPTFTHIDHKAVKFSNMKLWHKTLMPNTGWSDILKNEFVGMASFNFVPSMTDEFGGMLHSSWRLYWKLTRDGVNVGDSRLLINHPFVGTNYTDWKEIGYTNWLVEGRYSGGAYMNAYVSFSFPTVTEPVLNADGSPVLSNGEPQLVTKVEPGTYRISAIVVDVDNERVHATLDCENYFVFEE